MELAVETSNLAKKYGSLLAVDGLNLKVEEEAIHGFLGPNGAGKTTTIKMLVGLLKPDGGSARILGTELEWDKPELRSKVGYMPELPKLPKHLKGRELLDLYGRMHGMTRDAREEQVPNLLSLIGLEERGNDLIGTYSKGMQQRLGLAQALLNEPELLILDEPSIGLDPVGMVEVRDIMRELSKKGVTIFLSSHLLHEVEQVCTHVTMINKGVAMVSGTLKEISTRLKSPLAIDVEVEKLSQLVIENLEKLPFIGDIDREGDRLLIALKTRDDVRSTVSQALTSAGGIILSMNQKGASLEDAFLKLLDIDINEKGER